MLKIAICDDETSQCDELEKILSDILDDKNIIFDIDLFYSGKGLCGELNRIKYDLVLLDIELPDVNGIGIGRYIRETLKNETMQIA